MDIIKYNTQCNANRYSITLSSFNCSTLQSWMCSDDVLVQEFFWQKGYLHQLQKFVPSTYIKLQIYSTFGISFMFLTTEELFDCCFKLFVMVIHKSIIYTITNITNIE